MRVLLFWTSSCFVVRVRFACILSWYLYRLFIRRAVKVRKLSLPGTWTLQPQGFFCLSLTMKAEREAIMDIG